MDLPVSTVCGHSFCADCLSSSIAAIGTSCPVCRSEIPSALPKTNMLLKRIIDRVRPQVEVRGHRFVAPVTF